MATKKKAKSPNSPQPAAKPQTSQTTAPSKPRKSVKQRKQQRSQLWLIAAAAVVVVIIGALLVLNNRTQAQVAAPPATTSLPAEFVDRSVKGSPDARVIVTEFSDFECPACKGFAQGTARIIEEEYVKTGLARFEYKHLPLPQHEPSATNAALAAECAADQGMFWPMHDYLFQEQGKQGTNTFTQIRLRAMAGELGLNVSQFEQCFSRQTHMRKVQQDVAESRQLAVNATPTIFVNGQRILSPSLTELRNAIDAALREQGVQ
jgi:protein-disulfide isomerase